jgi:hypothetical protein
MAQGGGGGHPPLLSDRIMRRLIADGSARFAHTLDRVRKLARSLPNAFR